MDEARGVLTTTVNNIGPFINSASSPLNEYIVWDMTFKRHPDYTCSGGIPNITGLTPTPIPVVSPTASPAATVTPAPEQLTLILEANPVEVKEGETASVSISLGNPNVEAVTTTLSVPAPNGTVWASVDAPAVLVGNTIIWSGSIDTEVTLTGVITGQTVGVYTITGSEGGGVTGSTQLSVIEDPYTKEIGANGLAGNIVILLNTSTTRAPWPGVPKPSGAGSGPATARLEYSAKIFPSYGPAGWGTSKNTQFNQGGWTIATPIAAGFGGSAAVLPVFAEVFIHESMNSATLSIPIVSKSWVQWNYYAYHYFVQNPPLENNTEKTVTIKFNRGENTGHSVGALRRRQIADGPYGHVILSGYPHYTGRDIAVTIP